MMMVVQYCLLGYYRAVKKNIIKDTGGSPNVVSVRIWKSNRACLINCLVTKIKICKKPLWTSYSFFFFFSISQSLLVMTQKFSESTPVENHWIRWLFESDVRSFNIKYL